MSGSAELLVQATRCGLVTPREVSDGSAAVREASAQHRVFAITVHDHPVAYVKQQAAAEPDDRIARERRALLTLVDTGCAPQVMANTPADGLWVSVVGGQQLGRQRGSFAALAELCAAWGAAVARLHRTPTRGSAPLLAPRPWVLDRRSAGPLARGVRPNPAQAQVLRAFDAMPGLRAAVAEVAGRWTELAWIHGDLSASNVLVEQRPSLRVRFVDLDSAGLGDPAWDLATALDTVDGLAGSWRAPAALLGEAFLHGYRRAGGLGLLYPAMRAVRAVASAWEAAETLPAGEAGAEVRARLVGAASWLDRSAHAPLAA